MLGLEWKDIDWDNRVIKVRRTSNYTAERGIYTDTTKTRKSKRSGRYPQVVFDLLNAYKAEQDEERIRIGKKWIDNDRIFVKWNGEEMNNSCSIRTFLAKPIVKLKSCDKKSNFLSQLF